MSKLFNFKVVTPDKILYEGKVKQLITETLSGKIEILPLHSKLIATLKPAVSKIVDENDKERYFFSSSGILNVGSEETLMLIDAAEWPEDIDEKRAIEAKNRAEKRLSEKKGNINKERAQMALLRAVKRLEILDK